MKLHLKIYVLRDGEWTCTHPDAFIVATDPEYAWHFARRMLSGSQGYTSIHHVRDPLKAALTHQRFAAILREQGSGRPVSFGSVENPNAVMTVDTP